MFCHLNLECPPGEENPLFLPGWTNMLQRNMLEIPINGSRSLERMVVGMGCTQERKVLDMGKHMDRMGSMKVVHSSFRSRCIHGRSSSLSKQML